jgi:hypothetical protein
MGAPPHAAVVAVRHCAAASDRKMQRVEREMRWRCINPAFPDAAARGTAAHSVRQTKPKLRQPVASGKPGRSNSRWILLKDRSGKMADCIEKRVRSMEEALADLIAKHQKSPRAELARMIRQLEIEIAERRRPPER